MDFDGTGIRLTEADFEDVARPYSWDPAMLKAFTVVEAAGSGFDTKNRLKVLPEPHVFFRRLRGGERDDAVRRGLAYPSWGQQPYDGSQDARYDRLARMMEISISAALESCSWGLGQIMGFNSSRCAYTTAENMVLSMLAGEAVQLQCIAAFLVTGGLSRAMAERDYHALAEGYNGALQERQDYEGKLRRAYERLAAARPLDADPLSDGVLSRGDVGPAVKELQRALTSAGYSTGGIDYAFGVLTDQSVRKYQRAKGLAADGKVGVLTATALGLSWAA